MRANEGANEGIGVGSVVHGRVQCLGAVHAAQRKGDRHGVAVDYVRNHHVELVEADRAGRQLS